MSFLRSFLNRFKKQPGSLDVCKKSLDELDEFTFCSLYSSKYAMDMIPVMFGSIEAYISNMGVFIRIDHNKQVISTHQFNKDIKPIYLQEFLLSEKGMMLDLGETIKQFRSTAHKFFDVLDSMEGECAERNKAIVSRFVVSIKTIIDFLQAIQIGTRYTKQV